MNAPDIRLAILRQQPLWFDVEEGVEAKQESRSSRSARLLWTNWLLLFLDYFQYMSLFVNTAFKARKWEKDLMTKVAWLNIPALDVYGYLMSRPYTDTSSAGTSATPLPYAGYFYAFMLLPLVLYITKRAAYCLTDRYRRAGFVPRRGRIAGWMFLLGYVFLLPQGLAVLRASHCSHDAGTNSALAVDSDVECESHQALVYSAVGGISFFAFALTLAFSVWRQIARVDLSRSDNQHEAHLQLLESHYAERVNEKWLTKRLYLFSSFHRQGAYTYVIQCLMKLCLGALFAHTSSNLVMRSAGFVAVFFLQTCYLIKSRPYRVRLLTFASLVIALSCLGMSNMFLMVEAGLQQALLEPPHYNNFIFIFTYAPLGILFIGSLYHAFMIFVMHKHIWPRSGARIKQQATPGFDVADLLDKGGRVLESCWESNPLLAPVHEVARMTQMVNAALHQNARQQMRSRQLIIEHDQMRQLLEDLKEARNSAASRSIYASTVKSTVWHSQEVFESLLPDFVGRCQATQRETLLISSKLKRARLKTLAFNMFKTRLERSRRRTSESEA